ncbi:internal scaffolding protein [Blackfly microvirus SF02]|uniref:Internal scaffolding protein n=1 Tax=Blackfly microvirus SF02 TaxID=2576452 RepID=A0A4P8PJV2_9VIRU|nr:internal scaffolding protein [Blackfly microvirus SF02]
MRRQSYTNTYTNHGEQKMIHVGRYMERKVELASVNVDPSETDQSGSDDTDINVIVKRYGVYGTVPQGKKPAVYGEDYSQLPDDLRGFIETARTIDSLRGELPTELAALTIEDLVTYTPEAIAALLAPKQPTEEPK